MVPDNVVGQRTNYSGIALRILFKESSDVVPVGIRVAFAGDVVPLRSSDIGRMVENPMLVRRQYFYLN